MFERFHADAREAVVQAQREANSLGHREITPAHLLLGLLLQEGGTAAAAMHRHGLTPESLRARLAALPARPARSPGLLGRLLGGRSHLPFAKAAKQALHEALRTALQFKHNRIGTGHILLGALQAGTGADTVLSGSSVSADALAATTTHLLTGDGT